MSTVNPNNPVSDVMVTDNDHFPNASVKPCMMNSVQESSFQITSQCTQQHPHTRTQTSDKKKTESCHDVDDVIRTMDKTYGTKFYDWIRSEANLECTAMHIRKNTPDTELKSLANGIRWIVANWTIDNIAQLLCLVTREWRAEQEAELASIVSNDWPLKPYTSRLVMCATYDMNLEDMVTFFGVLTSTWSTDSTLELVTDIAEKSRWSGEQLSHFSLRLAWYLKKTRTMDSYDLHRMSLFCRGAHDPVGAGYDSMFCDLRQETYSRPPPHNNEMYNQLQHSHNHHHSSSSSGELQVQRTLQHYSSTECILNTMESHAHNNMGDNNISSQSGGVKENTVSCAHSIPRPTVSSDVDMMQS
eukprot:CFRG0766T1